MTDATAISGAPPLLDGAGAVLAGRDLVLCDIWGVLHNGVAAFAPACAALTRFRAGGGTVVLVSNAPRPGENVATQLDGFGVPRDCYDTIVASGDVTRGELARRPGAKAFHIGPDRDLPVFEGLDVARVAEDAADLVVCTGLWNDDTETPEDYRALLARLAARNLFMICGNPDIVVERGDRLVYCAGAIADLYATMGGRVLYAGKPHAPIYAAALAEAARRRGRPVERARVLAIGDSVRTDLAGAAGQGIDCLFVLAGIHAGEIDGHQAEALAKLFRDAPALPVAAMRRLVW